MSAWRCSSCGTIVERSEAPGRPTLDDTKRLGSHLIAIGGCGSVNVVWQLVSVSPVKSGERLKEQGMARATAASSGWVERFDRELERRAASGLTFTSEDVTHAVGQPPSSGAVGARINAAAKRGLIEHVGYTKARRANQHGAELRTWKGRTA